MLDFDGDHEPFAPMVPSGDKDSDSETESEKRNDSDTEQSEYRELICTKQVSCNTES